MNTTDQAPPRHESSAGVDNDNNKNNTNTTNSPAEKAAPFKPDWRFWLIYLSLCLVGIATAVDNTVIFTALPTITRELGGGDQYVWIANSYVIASTAVQPLFGQLSNVLGRRIPSLFVVALFALGSGIAGGANSIAMLFAGRTLQGLGCGGIAVLLDVVICDLVPLRERGKYLGPLLAATGVGSTLGPVIGGALVKASWRWVFYITLPFAGLALVTMFVFLKMKHTRDKHWKTSVVRIDFPGNALFIASITAVLLGLLMGGTTFPWDSWRIILPLVLGFIGWGLFHVYQASPWCKEPTVPPRLFSNRTSSVGFVFSFLSGVVLEWIIFFYPLYFQALLGASPLESGVNTLPFNAFFMPACMIGGVLLTKTGTYRPFHAAGFGFLALGLGLSSMLDSTSSTAEWAIFQLILALGLGLIFVTILPPIQAALPERDVATATATYSFFRSFGFVWGVTIPSLILNSSFNKHLDSIHDDAVRAELAGGGAYQFAAYGSIEALPAETRQEVIDLYSTAFRTTWLSSLAFAFVGVLLVFVEQHLHLREELDTEFGIEAKEKTVEDGKLEGGVVST